MVEFPKLYRCSICGRVVEEEFEGKGPIICCGKEMELLEEKEKDVGNEKHVPVYKVVDEFEIKVSVGEVLHPMEKDHYIKWIEVITDKNIYRKFLNPGEEPVAFFNVPETEKILKIRSYCNKHGLWKNGRENN